MSSKQAAAGVLFLITGLLAHADWRTLASDDGRTVEIAVDFKIDDVHIGSNGDLSIVATSSEHGEEVGF
jgi:hypothetical protein